MGRGDNKQIKKEGRAVDLNPRDTLQSRILENPQSSCFASGNPDSRLTSYAQVASSPFSLLGSVSLA